MSGVDPTRKRNEPIVRREHRSIDAAQKASSADKQLTGDLCTVHEANVFGNVFSGPAATAIAQASIRRAPSEIPSSPKQAALILELECLRREAQPWHSVRARLSHEEPNDLQILYRTQGMKEWLTSIATASQLVETLERIGGSLPQQMEWLNFAGVTLAPSAGRRDLILNAEDNALLERFDRYRSVAELEAELAALAENESSTSGSAHKVENRIPSRDFFERRGKLLAAQATALREAGLDEASWSQEKERFHALFRAHAVTTAHRVLRTSGQAIDRERKRYASTGGIEALRSATQPLHALETKVAALNKAYLGARPTKQDFETPASLAAFERLLAAKSERDALRKALAEEHVILHEPKLDIEALAHSAIYARGEIDRVVTARLADIEKMHGAIDADTDLVFDLDHLMVEAKDTLKIHEGSAGDIVLRAELKRAQGIKTILDSATTAAAIGLGLLTGGGGAIGLAASVVSTSFGVMSTIDSAHRYSIEASAARTAFDRAKALSSKEPSAFWLAADIAGTVLDIGAFAKTFTALHDTARAALNATSPAEIERAHARLVHLAGQAPERSVVDVDELSSAAVSAFERERERTVLLAAHANTARAISAAHPALAHEELTGLLRLEEATREAVLNAFANNTEMLRRLGHLADAHASAARGIDRLLQIADGPTSVELASEIASWRNSPRAQALVERLGDARTNAEDLAELTEAVASRSSISAKANILDQLAKETLPARRADVEAFAQRNGVPVLVNEAGSGREARVYFVAREGLVDDIQVELGPRATLADLELHQRTVEKIAEYRGLLGRASRFVDNVQEWRGRDVIRPGQPAYRQALELEKLPEVIRRREAQLAGSFTPERTVRLEAEIESLKEQLDTYQHAFADELPELDLDFVAALSDAQREALRLERAAAFPRYSEVAELDGMTMAQIEDSAALKEKFSEFYRTDRDGVIYRRDGRTDDVPLLRAGKADQNEGARLRFASAKAVDPPIPLPRAHAKEVAAFLERNSESWTLWKEALISQEVLSEPEITAVIQKAMASKNAPETVESLRNLLKAATRDRLVARCFDGAMSGSESYERLTKFVFKLNPADQGSVAELWYIAHAKRYRGIELDAHPELWTGPKNAPVKLDRKPDNLWVAGNELGEVKSTTKGLEKRDIQQIHDTRQAMRSRDGVRVAEGFAPIKKYKLTFIDAQGALKSSDELEVWLRSSKDFRLEIFDVKGELHILDRAYLNRLESQGSALRIEIEKWTKR